MISKPLLFLSLCSAVLAYFETPVYGNIRNYGYYFLKLFVGSNDQPQTVILDSGSATTSFPCIECKNCGVHFYPFYQVDDSKSSYTYNCRHPDCVLDQESCDIRGSICKYRQRYMEGSIVEGFMFSDLIRFQSLSEMSTSNKAILLAKRLKDVINTSDHKAASPVSNTLYVSHKDADLNATAVPPYRQKSIGCLTQVSPLFKSQFVNGIIGIGPGHSPKIHNAIDEFYDYLNIKERIMSLCLSNNGGMMTLSGILKVDDDNQPIDHTKLDWIPMVSKSQYLVRLLSIRTTSSPVVKDIDDDFILDSVTTGTQVLIDSGTTFTYVSVPQYNKLRNQFRNFCMSRSIDGQQDRYIDKCYFGTEDVFCFSPTQYLRDLVEQSDSFEPLNDVVPSIELTFAKDYGMVSKYKWAPSSFMYLNGINAYCAAISVSHIHQFILGSNFFVDNLVSIDRQKNKIAFRRTKCPSFVFDHSS